MSAIYRAQKKTTIG